MKIAHVQWFGHRAVEYSNGGTTAVLLPGRGAKIVSLRDPDGHEWLLQPTAGRASPHPPGVTFTDAEMCGWDECAPSVDASVNPTGGPPVPDHGDLWDAAWTPAAGTPDELSAALPSIGATFSRRVRIDARGRLRLHYRVQHLDPRGVPAPLLWAAHPMLRGEPGDTVDVRGASTAWEVSAPSPARLEEPIATVLARERPPGSSVKYYLDPEERADRATLRRADGRALSLSWNPRELPYLGIWFDDGRFTDGRAVALEPATGWYDSLERAAATGRVLTLRPGGVATWTLVATLTR